jgi:hypothetical protein
VRDERGGNKAPNIKSQTAKNWVEREDEDDGRIYEGRGVFENHFNGK